MRFLVVILIWAVIVGGLGLYQDVRPRAGPPEGPAAAGTAARTDCVLEVTTTFDLRPDPFALDGAGPGRAAALTVRHSGGVVLARDEGVTAGRPISTGPLPVPAAGVGEFFIEAAAPLELAGSSQGVRVRLVCGGRTVEDLTFWSDGAGRAAGVLRARMGPDAEDAENGHER